MRSYLVCFLLLPACAQLHHAQIGDIDDRPAASIKPVDVKLSETGISTREARLVAETLAYKSAHYGARHLRDGFALIELFQMGPRTGEPSFDATYAEGILDLLRAECPNGELANLQLVREARRYPVISGEIVKVTGECRSSIERTRPS